MGEGILFAGVIRAITLVEQYRRRLFHQRGQLMNHLKVVCPKDCGLGYQEAEISCCDRLMDKAAGSRRAIDDGHSAPNLLDQGFDQRDSAGFTDFHLGIEYQEVIMATS